MSLLRRLTASSQRQIDLGLLLLRLWFGLMLAYGHGLDKMRNLEAFTATVAKHGFPSPWLMAIFAAGSELFGGVLLALGLLTRLSAAAVTGTMLGAAFWVHRADPFIGKKEFALCYATAGLVLLITGPGRFSLDRRFFGTGS